MRQTKRMPNAIHGSLITCDEPIKTYIEHVNEQLPVEQRFIISSLDRTHLLIQPERKFFVQTKVEQFINSNQFTLGRDQQQLE